ncbi:hypothetical protein DRH14_02220 [Candidatus Shapirobacteria bacterium]|nr:MAG: hypothetical protein DRH14_02220 [Candidatus Shapirobacteria bacterium]
MRFDAVFFSPHLDDAVLSCGGLITKLIKKGKKVLVVTVFSSGREVKVSSRTKWWIGRCGFKDVVKLFMERRIEDRKVAASLGFAVKHLGFIDASFRVSKEMGVLVYKGFKDVFGQSKIKEIDLKKKIENKLLSLLDGNLRKKVKFYFPLALGNHVDHLILREIGMDLSGSYGILFWEDYPYSLYLSAQKQLQDLSEKFVLKEVEDVMDFVEIKREMIRHYKSQVKSLFRRKRMYLSARETFYEYKKDKGNDKDKRVFFITDEIDVGGAKIANDYLLRELTKLKLDFRIYEQVSPNFKYGFVGTKRLFWSILNFVVYLKIWVKRSDVILTTSPNLVFAIWLMRFLGLMEKIPKLFYYCHSDRSFFSKSIKGEKSGLRFVYHRFYLIFYKWLELKSVFLINRIIVPGQSYKDRLLEKYGGKINKDWIYVVPHGIDKRNFYPVSEKEKWSLRKKLKIGVRTKIIVYCGRIDPFKGIDKLIKSLQYIDLKFRVKLIILTFEPDKVVRRYFDYLVNLSGMYKKNNLRQVLFIYPKNKKEIADWYRLADCVVLPSEMESFSMVALEAVSCGSVFVGTETGIMKDLLLRIESDLLLKRTDFKYISGKIDYVLNLSERNREGIIKKGLTVIDDYSWKKTAMDLERCI